MAGQGFALFAFDQDFHFQNAGDVRGERLDQRRDGEFFREHAGAVAVGESGVDVDDGEAGIDEIDAANVGAGRKRVRRRLIEIERDAGREAILRRAADGPRAAECARTARGARRYRRRRQTG